MSNRAKFLLTCLTVAFDAAAAAVAFYLAYYLRTTLPLPTPLNLGPFNRYIAQLIIQVISLVITFFFYRLYHLPRTSSRIDHLYSLFSAVSISTVMGTTLSYLVSLESKDLTRGLILYYWVAALLLTAVGRIITMRVQRLVRSKHPDRLLIIGTGEVAHMILAKTMQSPQLGYRVVGFVDSTSSTGDIAGVPVLGHKTNLGQIVREHQIQEAVIALPDASHDELLELISACEAERATVRIFPDLFQIIASELSIDDLGGLPLLTVRNVALRGWKLSVKRAMDIIVSAAGLVCLAPLLMLVAALIKLGSRGPVFYSQIRVGLDGKPFPMLKFRSMRMDAEEHSGPVWASADDPRRTRLGTFLRKSSIDELPQLINVLLGDMSLVGPRPERPFFVEQFKQVVPRYMERHKEKAGLTGWAQVNGLRGETSIVERTKYDLYYIENWSLLLDLKILIRTVVNQFRGDRNAY